MVTNNGTTQRYDPDTNKSMERTIGNYLKPVGKFVKDSAIGTYTSTITPLRIPTAIRRLINKQTIFNETNKEGYILAEEKETNKVGLSFGLSLGSAFTLTYLTSLVPEIKDLVTSTVPFIETAVGKIIELAPILGKIPYKEVFLGANAASLAVEAGRIKSSVLERKTLNSLNQQTQ